MPALPVTCGQCGAPLDIPEGVRFVTCAFCSTRLELVHEGNVGFTVALQSVATKVSELSIEVKIQRLLAEIERLDRDWGAGRVHGRRLEPSSSDHAAERIGQPGQSGQSGQSGQLDQLDQRVSPSASDGVGALGAVDQRGDWVVGAILGVVILIVPCLFFEHVLEWQKSVDEDIVWALRFASLVAAIGATYGWVQHVRHLRERASLDEIAASRSDVARRQYEDEREGLCQQIDALKSR